MRKLLIFAALLCGLTNLFAQNTEPSPLEFTYSIGSTTFTNEPFEQDRFSQDEFIISTQWNGHPKVLNALLFNCNESTQPRIEWGANHALFPITDPSKRLKQIWDCRLYEDGRSFIFEPTLEIHESQRGQLIRKTNDTTGAYFGFTHVKGTKPLPNDPNYDRLVLYRNNLPSYGADSIVLTNSWPKGKYTYYSNAPNQDQNHFNGTLWHLSINLRRLNAAEINSGTDTVLTIILPYMKKTGINTWVKDSIKFSQRPSLNVLDTTNLDYREDRGAALDMIAAPLNTKCIAIRKNTLPDANLIASGFEQDITINAYFECNDLPNRNPFFKPRISTPYIDTMDIIVKYHGKTDIAINWIRLSTPQGYDVQTGRHDLELQTYVQAHINNIAANGYEFYHMYGDDEHGEEEFYTQRYFSRLYNYCKVEEGAGGENLNGLIKAENPMYLWAGAKNFREYTHAPFFRRNIWESVTPYDTLIYKMKYQMGYIGHRTADTLHSSYETDLDNGSWWDSLRLSTFSYKFYKERMQFESGTQLHLEYRIHDFFYQNSEYLYGDKNWWSNNYPFGNWGTEIISSMPSSTFSVLGNMRTQTGEETSAILWMNLIFGAKGLAYDGLCYKFLNGNSDNLTIGCLSSSLIDVIEDPNMTEDSIIYSDHPAFGGDYITTSDNATDMYRFINFDSTSKYLGVRPDRFYYGRKSPRVMIYNTHRWIRANESILMDLKLAATYSKGFRIWQSADTARFTANILSKFLVLEDSTILYDKNNNKTYSVNGIKTRPFDRTANGAPSYETWDSTFVDITLLRDKDDADLTGDSWCLGILNRRTDPLFLMNRIVANQLIQYLEFVPTAKFYDLMRNGGSFGHFGSDTNMSAADWKKMYNKRLGCRELTIPFNYRNPIDTNEYCLLRVTELDKGTSLENEWWRQEPFMFKVDTVIGQDSKLIVKMGPGDGKILRVEVLHPPKNITGKLDFSNQSKLISFPVYIGSRKSDSIRYHMVYYRPTQVTNPPKTVNMVYYVRSKILWKDSPDENIVWETPVCISDTICNAVYQIPDTLFSYQCQYPSIVVRKDGTGSPRAYIVYSCDIDTECGGYIAETELDVGTTNVRDNYGNVLSKFISDRPNSWLYGIPCINASSNGNYYAWSDSTIGIIAGFKIPGDLTLRDTARLKFNNPYPGINANRWGQPSMNVYSDIQNGSNNCSLVWREQDTDGNEYIINYTKLKYLNNELKHYIPTNCFRGRPLLFLYAINADTTIACINKSNYTVSYPNISRQLRYSPYNNANYQNEAVFWQEKEPRNDGTKITEILKYRFISVTDSSNIPIRWFPSSANIVKSLTSDLFSPNINNAVDLMTYYFQLKIGNNWVGPPDSTKEGGYGLDFEYFDQQFNLKIAQIPFALNGLFSKGIMNVNSIPLKKIGPGRFPHLSNYPFYEDNKKVWANRQVYNHGEASVPDIWASANGFYRELEDDYLLAEPMVGFKLSNTGNVANYMITLPFINDEPTKLFLPYEEIEDSICGNWYAQIKKDTLLTDWFVAGPNSEVSFKCKGRVNNQFSMFIEKENDTILFPVYLPEIMEDSACFFRVIMINGLNQNYRLLFINKDTLNGYYTEDLFIDGVPILDTILTRKSNDIQVINLNPGYNQDINNKLLLITKPNPASDKIEVRVIKYENEEAKGIAKSPRFKVVLYGFTGEKLFETEVNGKQSTVINTENYSPGSYFIRAEEIPSRWGDAVSSPAVEKIIISR